MDEFTILISVIVSQVKHMSKIIKLYNLNIGSLVICKLYFNKTDSLATSPSKKNKIIFTMILILHFWR